MIWPFDQKLFHLFKFTLLCCSLHLAHQIRQDGRRGGSQAGGGGRSCRGGDPGLHCSHHQVERLPLLLFQANANALIPPLHPHHFDSVSIVAGIQSNLFKANFFHNSEDDRKLFVGGLPQEAKDLDIKEYFGQYGEIDNINLKTDPHTGRSRGFAFIVFKDTEGLNAASAQEAHVIKGKKVTCKKAEAKQGKIYVGKLPTEGVSVEDIQNYFAQVSYFRKLISLLSL